MENLLQLKNINKTFGEVAAVHDVNLTIGDNEIVGLLGDNGAGKSTLVKMITGYHQPDPGGEIYWSDQKVEHLSVPKARELGIEVVYQERALADQQILMAQYLHGTRIDESLGPAARQENARRDPDADEYGDGVYVFGRHARFGRGDFFRRRTTGRGDHARALF